VGFRKQEDQYRLSFDGTKLDGLVATMRSVDVGKLLDVAELAELGNNITPENVGRVRDLFQALADYIVEWNYEDADGRPVPTTYAGVTTLGLPEAVLLLTEWINAVARVDAPLGPRSNGGGTSPALSLPMEPRSESRAS
jgi:hypothetical protein